MHESRSRKIPRMTHSLSNVEDDKHDIDETIIESTEPVICSRNNKKSDLETENPELFLEILEYFSKKIEQMQDILEQSKQPENTLHSTVSKG